eukprot:gene302-biopygen276
MAVSIYRGMGVSGLACDPKGLETFLLGPGAVRSWTIGTDYVLGGYSGECAPGSSAAANSGCSCNQGGRTAWLYQVTLASSAPKYKKIAAASGNSSLSIPQSKCYMEAADLPVPLLVTVLESSGSSLDLSGITGLGDLGKSVAARMGYIPRTESRPAIQLVVNSFTSTSDNYVTNIAADQMISVVAGIASQTVKLGSFLQFGILRPSEAADFEYNTKMFHVTPTCIRTIYSSLGIPIEAAAPPGEAYHYCVPSAFSIPRPSTDSYVASARSFWNCPLSFTSEASRSILMPRKPPSLRAGANSCSNQNQMCIINGDGSTSFPQNVFARLQTMTQISILIPLQTSHCSIRTLCKHSRIRMPLFRRACSL